MDPGRPRAEVVLRRGDEELGRWTLEGDGGPDLELVDEMARLVLAAKRAGCSIRLADACPELVELLDLVGLREALGAGGLQVVGEAEGGEEGGVEEVVVPDDPVA